MRNFCYRVWQVWGESNLPGVIGAIIVMLVGWLIALWLAGKVARTAGKCMDMSRKISGTENDALVKKSGSLAGKITFYGVMLLVLLAAMSLLRLEYAAVPLREFVTVIAGYLPNIAGALLLLLLAWFIAGVVRNMTARIVEKYEISERLEKHFSLERHRSMMYVVNGTGFLVYLFFLPAILNALGIFGITAPLQAMFAVVLLYLPRLFAAFLILFVGFWAAKVVRKAVTAVIIALRLENFGKWCGLKEDQLEMPARFIGWLAWVLVALPVITGALNVLGIEALSRPAADFMALLLTGAGMIIGALLIVLASVIAGKLAGGAVTHIIARSGMDSLMTKLGLGHEKLQEYPLSVVCGKVVWIVIVIFGLLGACDVLGLNTAAMLIRDLALFGGNLLVSLVILLAGVAVANFVADITVEKLGKTAACALKCAVILLAVTMALSNLEVGRMVVEMAFFMLLGAFCVAFALAFGLGGREFAAKVLETWREKLR